MSDSQLDVVNSYYLPEETDDGTYVMKDVKPGQAFFRFFAQDAGKNVGFCDFHIKVLRE